jgi:2-keto-4-pentenoate hydratase
MNFRLLSVSLICLLWLQSVGSAQISQELTDAYAQRIHAAWQAGQPMPRLSRLNSQADLEQSYLVQKAFVHLAYGQQGIAGFKSAAVTQEGVDQPYVGVMPRDGVLRSAEQILVRLSEDPSRWVETEIGFRFGKKVTAPFADVSSLQEAVSEILAVVELPGGSVEGDEPVSWIDLVAININAKQMVLGSGHAPATVNPDAVKITLRHNDQVLAQASGGEAAGGQWPTLLRAANRIISQGYQIQPGQVITNGAVGKIMPAEPGSYRADFGTLGQIEFEVSSVPADAARRRLGRADAQIAP